MKELAQLHPFLFWAAIVSVLFSLRIVLGLWLLPQHRRTGVVKRAFWSVVILFPFAGPIFYGAFYRVPSIHRPGESGPENRDAFAGGHGS